MRYFLWVFVLSTAHAQIQINELMIDPNPAIELPGVEYIELINLSDSTVNLKGYSIADLSKKVFLPDVVILPKAYALLIKTSDTSLFEFQTIGLSSWPTLNNISDEIRLYHKEEVIDSVFYFNDWYGVPTDGGFSLERKSHDKFCSVRENWSVSTNSKGGTPGQQNSIFTENPKIPRNKIIGHKTDGLTVLNFETEIRSSGFTILVNEKVAAYKVLEKQIFIENEWLNGKIHLSILNLKNCVDDKYDIDTVLIVSSLPKRGDLILNEILFNPSFGGEDYVEIVNTTNTFLDISSVDLSNFDEGILDEKSTLNHKIINPLSMLCFTKNKHYLVNQYPNADAKNIIEVGKMPTLRNDSGSVIISIDNQILDKFTYTKDKHHKLLEDVEGVALERVEYTKDLWHSAATSQNYGTPGYRNSQAVGVISDMVFTIEPKVFTPNFDGVKDFTVISYNLENSGYVGSITVFNLNGVKIKTIVSNSILASKGEFIWDGIADNGTRAAIGYYIVLFELDMHNKIKKKLKKTVVLGARFN